MVTNASAIPEGIFKKLQALFNLQEGATAIGSLEEAETAGLMAQKLLMKYNLSADEVSHHKIAQKAKMTNESIQTGEMGDKREGDWITKLYTGVATSNLCKVSTTRGFVRIFGHEINVALVLYICEQMTDKIRIVEKMAFKKYETTGGNEKRGTFRRGFFEGAAVGVTTKLREEKQEMATNEFAVMIISKEAEVQEYLYELYPYLRPETQEERQKRSDEYAAKINAMTDKERKAHEKSIKGKPVKYLKGPKKLKSTQGWQQGYEAGKKLSINKGVDSNSQSSGALN